MDEKYRVENDEVQSEEVGKSHKSQKSENVMRVSRVLKRCAGVKTDESDSGTKI